MQKLYFSISEISELIGETSNVLRYWEKEFPILKPKKNRKGNRTYSPKDLTILKSIKKLLRDDMLSVKDAKARLQDEIKRMEAEVEEVQETEAIAEVEASEEIEAIEENQLAEEIEAIEEAEETQLIEDEINEESTNIATIEDEVPIKDEEALIEDEDDDETEEMFDITDSIQDIYINYVEKDEVLSFLDELLKKVKNL